MQRYGLEAISIACDSYVTVKAMAISRITMGTLMWAC